MCASVCVLHRCFVPKGISAAWTELLPHCALVAPELAPTAPLKGAVNTLSVMRPSEAWTFTFCSAGSAGSAGCTAKGLSNPNAVEATESLKLKLFVTRTQVLSAPWSLSWRKRERQRSKESLFESLSLSESLSKSLSKSLFLSFCLYLSSDLSLKMIKDVLTKTSCTQLYSV